MQKRTIQTLPEDLVRTNSRDDDISLVDLWFVVGKRWRWVLAGVLSGFLIAIAYVTFAAPVYESYASIQIGKVHELGSIENIEALTTELNDQYGPTVGDGGQRGMPYLKQVIKVSGQSNIIRLVSLGRSPEEARDYLEQLITNLLQRHQELYKEAIDPIRRRLDDIDKQIPLLTKRLQELEALVMRLKGSEPVQASFMMIERSRLDAQLNELERDRVALQQKSTSPYTSPTKVIVPATLLETSVAPKTTVSMAVGLALGLVLGLLAAFGREIYANARIAPKSDTRGL